MISHVKKGKKTPRGKGKENEKMEKSVCEGAACNSRPLQEEMCVRTHKTRIRKKPTKIKKLPVQEMTRCKINIRRKRQ
jgi:hypothetical protein